MMIKKILLLSSLVWGSPYVLLDQFHGMGVGYENSKGDLFLAFGGKGKKYRENISHPPLYYEAKLTLGFHLKLMDLISFPLFIGGAVDFRNDYARRDIESYSNYYVDYSLSLGVEYPIGNNVLFYGYDNIYFQSVHSLNKDPVSYYPINYFEYNPKFGFAILF